jgi:hypothetical protein
MKNQEYFITHVVPEELPKKGFRKLLFYTTKVGPGITKEQYYWGKGSHPFDSKQISQMVRAGKIFDLPQRLKLEDGMGLWIDAEGKLYYSSLEKPNRDNPIPSPKALSKISRIYDEIKAVHSVPNIKDRTTISNS